MGSVFWQVNLTPSTRGTYALAAVGALDATGNGGGIAAKGSLVGGGSIPGLPVSIQLILNMQDLPLTRPQSLVFNLLVDSHELAPVPLHIVAPPTLT